MIAKVVLKAFRLNPGPNGVESAVIAAVLSAALIVAILATGATLDDIANVLFSHTVSAAN